MESNITPDVHISEGCIIISPLIVCSSMESNIVYIFIYKIFRHTQGGGRGWIVRFVCVSMSHDLR